MSHHGYQLVRAYIESKGVGVMPQVSQDLEHNEKNELVFELINNCLSKAKPSKSKPLFLKPLSFETLNELLSKLLGHNFSKVDARRFLDQLLFYPISYDRLTHSLQSICLPFPVNEKKLDGKVPSVDEIMQSVQSYQPAKKRSSVAMNGFKNVFNHAIDYIKYAPLPRRLALPAVLVILAVFLFRPTDNAAIKLYANYFGEDASLHNMGSLTKSTSGSTQLRSIDMTHGARQYQSAMDELNKGIRAYISREFKDAISILTRLGDTAAADECYVLQRDINFYTGLSYMGLSKGKTKTLKKAIPYFEKAFQISTEQELKMIDEVTFFMGYVYILLDDKVKAESYLEPIDESSIYFQESRFLLNQ